jgi:hypothetical protein
MEEIEFLFDLVPRGFYEFGLVVDELEVIGEGAVELDLKWDCLAFDDLLDYVLV